MAKAQSLAAQAGVVEAVQLPAVFQQPSEPVKARSLSPYIAFAHPRRSDEWNKLTGAFGQIAEGDMFLVTSEEAFHLAPAKLGWLCHKQYWVQANAAGEVLKTSFKEMPAPFKEHVEAVVLVYLEDRIVPANVCFRTTKCPAAKALSDALVEAASPAWADKSPQHKETLVCQQPFMRFYGIVELGPQRTSKSSGLPYRTTTAIVKPTGVSEWRALAEFTKSPDCNKLLEDAANRFEMRIQEMKLKA